MDILVTISKGEDFGYVVEAPSLPGCISQGKTKKEALKNIREAIEAYLEEIEDEIRDKEKATIRIAV